MLNAAPAAIASEDLRAARSRLRAARAELHEAQAAHRQDPSALTQMEVDFWTTTVRRDERAVRRAERQ